MVRARTGRSAFLISPTADVVLLIGSPLLALGATAGLVRVPALTTPRLFGGMLVSPLAYALGILVAAHLILTLAHVGGRIDIVRAHPLRFTLVPAALLAALAFVPGLRLVAVIVAVVWDVHHSGMQTFGLARHYAARAGAGAPAGRALDLLVNHVLYAGPILAGAGLALHLHAMGATGPVAPHALAGLAAAVIAQAARFRPVLIAVGLAAIAAWTAAQWRLAALGRPVAAPAIALVVATGVTSVLSWGLDPFGQALFTMKLFHCVQYFALVVHRDGGVAAALWGRAASGVPAGLAAVTLLVPALVYGAWAKWQVESVTPRAGVLALVLTVTLLHFWYDGFTWSVRRSTA